MHLCKFSLIFKWFFLFLLILNKREGNSHNFKIMEFVGLIHAKSIGLWWGPNICDFMIDWLIDLIVIHDWLIPLYDMHAIILYLFTNFCFPWSKPTHQSSTLFVSLVHSIILLWLLFIRYPCLINQWSYLLHLISRDSFLGT